jgi:uncharacterized membrane protein YccC
VTIHFQRGLVIGLCCLTSFWIAILVHLNESFWLILTNVILLTDTRSHPFYKGALRFIGTFGGGALGIFAINFFNQDIIFTSAGLFLLVTLFTFLGYRSEYYYAFLFASITFFMAIAFNAMNHYLTVYFVVWRVVEITLGVITSGLFSYFMPPVPMAYVGVRREERFKHTLKVSLSAFFSFYGCLIMDWYDSVTGVISSFLVTQEATFKGTHLKSIRRLLGCSIGALLAFFYLSLIEQTLISISLAIFMVTFCLMYCQSRFKDASYVYLQAAIAFFIAIMPSTSIMSDNINPALERLAGIFFGVGVSVFVNYLIFPSVHMKKRASSKEALTH